MTWSADFLADDWTRINNSEVARRVISRIEARQGYLAVARHSRPHRPRAARNSQRAQKPRLQDRSCGSGNCGPPENRDVPRAMGCPSHARAACESIPNAPTAPRNISPPWEGAPAEMSPRGSGTGHFAVCECNPGTTKNVIFLRRPRVTSRAVRSRFRQS